MLLTAIAPDQPSELSPRPDLEWAKRHLRGFAQWKQEVDELHADEERYRQHPGYTPRLKVPQ